MTRSAKSKPAAAGRRQVERDDVLRLGAEGEVTAGAERDVQRGDAQDGADKVLLEVWPSGWGQGLFQAQYHAGAFEAVDGGAKEEREPLQRYLFPVQDGLSEVQVVEIEPKDDGESQ